MEICLSSAGDGSCKVQNENEMQKKTMSDFSEKTADIETRWGLCSKEPTAEQKGQEQLLKRVYLKSQ